MSGATVTGVRLIMSRGPQGEDVGVGGQRAAHIAVGDDAGQRAVGSRRRR